MLQAIVFDHDGTLSPTSERQEAWFKHYILLCNDNPKKYWLDESKVPLKWPFNTFDEFLDRYNQECDKEGGVQNFYDLLGLPCDMKNKKHPVWAAYIGFNSERPAELYDGVKEMIEEIWQIGQLGKDPTLNRRLKLGINTTNSWQSIRGDLDKGGILPYFDCFITEELLRHFNGYGNAEPLKKPSPLSISYILQTLDVEGTHTMHVGDTLNDLRSSKKVIKLNPTRPKDLITVGACYGYEGRKKLEKGVETKDGIIKFDHLIEKPYELVDIVKKLI